MSKPLPEEGFQKDLYTGVIDTLKVGVITSIQRIVEQVFMDALAHPDAEGEDDCAMVKNLLLPGLRSFCSALKGTFQNLDEILHVSYLYLYLYIKTVSPNVALDLRTLN